MTNVARPYTSTRTAANAHHKRRRSIEHNMNLHDTSATAMQMKGHRRRISHHKQPSLTSFTQTNNPKHNNNKNTSNTNSNTHTNTNPHSSSSSQPQPRHGRRRSLLMGSSLYSSHRKTGDAHNAHTHTHTHPNTNTSMRMNGNANANATANAHTSTEEARNRLNLKNCKNFYPPESFINLLYRVTENANANAHAHASNHHHHHDSPPSTTKRRQRPAQRFCLCLLDIDNLRGHIQSPLQKNIPRKKQRAKQKQKKKKMKMNSKTKTKHKHKHTQPQPQPPPQSRNRESRPVSEADDEDDDDDDDDDEKSVLSESDEDLHHSNHRKHNIINTDDDDEHIMLATTMANTNNAPKSIAERTALMNHHRRHSSLLLKQLQLKQINHHNDDEEDDNDYETDDDEDEDEEEEEEEDEREPEIAYPYPEYDRNGRILAVGENNLNPYLMFWNDSKIGESVVKVVQDIILMTVVQQSSSQNTTLVHMTHFGFGEFGLFTSIASAREMAVLVQEILNRVASNVSTVRLGPVTVSAGICMYPPPPPPPPQTHTQTQTQTQTQSVHNKNKNKNNKSPFSISQWINRCRQTYRIAKNNGRGLISHYMSPVQRESLTIQLTRELKKPVSSLDFSLYRMMKYIKAGANLNLRIDGDTPLMTALKYQNMMAFRYLLRYNYNPNVQDARGKTVLILALERLRLSSSSSSSSSLSSSSTSSENGGAAHAADHAILVDLLISKRDLNPRVKDAAHNSALSIALQKGYKGIAKTLILLGAEPLLTESVILERWFSAAKAGRVEVILEMLGGGGVDEENEAEADGDAGLSSSSSSSLPTIPIDMIDEQDMTALMHACQNGHLPLSRVLVERGCNVNIQGEMGYTAVMLAVQAGQPHIWHYLVSTHAQTRTQTQTQTGARPQSESESQSEPLLLGLLGDDGASILMCAARGGMPEVVQHVMMMTESLQSSSMLDVNARDLRGNTALMIACQCDSASVAIELLRSRAHLELVNAQGRNALILCARSGASRIASMLITLGSEIDVQDAAQGRTALMYAAMHGHLAIVINLIKYGAAVDDVDVDDDEHGEHARLVDHQQLSAAALARQHGQTEIADLLESGSGSGRGGGGRGVRLKDNFDVLEQMEIYKKKNESLSKLNVKLQEINQQLSDDINRAELQRNEMRAKLQTAQSMLSSAMSGAMSKVGLSGMLPNMPTMPTMPKSMPSMKNLNMNSMAKLTDSWSFSKFRNNMNGNANTNTNTNTKNSNNASTASAGPVARQQQQQQQQHKQSSKQTLIPKQERRNGYSNQNQKQQKPGKKYSNSVTTNK